MKHLSSDQISTVVAGWSRDEKEQQHASSCPVCAAEIERLRELLTLFRASVRDWSEGSQTKVDLPRHVNPRLPERVQPRRVVWVLAAAALAVAVAVPVYQDVRERELKAQADADYLLIESVHSQLSRSAPMAMQPLMQLVAPSESDLDSGAADRRERE